MVVMVVVIIVAVAAAVASLTATIIKFWLANVHELSAHKQMTIALPFPLGLLVQMALWHHLQ